MGKKTGRETAGQEDVAHVSGDHGVQILCVRKDVAGSICGADGDYAPPQLDATGAVRISGSVSAATEFSEDAAHTTADKGIMTLAVRKDTAATTVDADGDYSPLLTDANGRLHVIDENSADIQDAVETIESAVAVAAGGAAPSKVMQVGGDDGTGDFYAMKVDTSGQLFVKTASGSIASGSIASGAIASGAIAAGAVAAGAVVSGAILAGALADGSIVTLGAKTDAKSTATDATSVSVMQVLKQISASVQASAGDLEMMDDWDDANKCRVTPVATDVVTYGSDTVFDADADNTAQVCKAGSGNLYKLDIYNSNAAIAFIQLFDVAAGSVTVGTTTPKYVLTIPPQGAASIDFAIPMSFDTAITYAATTTPTGSGDPTVGLTFSAVYK
jgi:hypothetical protein